jgi:adenylosuccinate synthase
VQDLFDPGILRQKLDLVLREKNQLLTKVYNRRGIDANKVADEYIAYGERLRPYVADTGVVLGTALDNDEVVLLEGAQATMLDVDHGTYPFVTSSSPTAGGACVGAGIGPTRITKVIGIVKAYTTRVGSGPFPTELLDEQGEFLRKTGGEYGVTTGRARRTGWFDAVVARYATRVNGVTDFFLTKLDVLSTLDKVPVCVAYEVDGKRYDEIPMTQTEFHHAKPVYEYLDGWWEDISKARTFDDLPAAARNYVKTIEELSGAPIAAVGVGPRRDQTLQLRPLL